MMWKMTLLKRLSWNHWIQMDHWCYRLRRRYCCWVVLWMMMVELAVLLVPWKERALLELVVRLDPSVVPPACHLVTVVLSFS
jgi:hypothetical protein